jgi:hypothetical protein
MLEFLKDRSAEWQRAAPADSDAVEALRTRMPDLPAAYLAFLRVSNGGEGELPVSPFWFQLWSAADVASLNEEYKTAEFIPGFVGFGSSGGGELLAFGVRPDIQGRVFAIPFIPMTEEEAQEIAPDFLAFAQQFGRTEPAA